MQVSPDRRRPLGTNIDFGTIELSKAQHLFLEDLNAVVLALCRSLPPSCQSSALLFLMQHAGLAIGEKLDFFRGYYPPAWSILYWLTRYGHETTPLTAADVAAAQALHALALKLHALDDHLHDGQIPTTHITLLLRSQIWLWLNDAANRLSHGVDRAHEVVGDLLDVYYTAMDQPGEVQDLTDYCRHFEHQMATWFIAPLLVCRRINSRREFTQSLTSAFLHFGIAWRLLDDLNDIQEDLEAGAHSAVYACLDAPLKSLWGTTGPASLKKVCTAIRREHIIPRLTDHIKTHLIEAASLAASCGLNGLGSELNNLSNLIMEKEG